MNLDKSITPETILVVDDAPENIIILKNVLKEYTIRPAIHGKAALKAVTVEPLPDLILLDIMMPGMDGYTVCQILKSDPLTQHIPIIFITGKNQEEDEVQGLQLGAVDYITKPFSPSIVQARVKTQLELKNVNRKLDKHIHELTEERNVIESILLQMRMADAIDKRHIRYLISPVEVTAGDILLAAFAPDGRQMVLLGDFTGHGLIAAIGGPLVSYIFQQLVKIGAPGEQIILEINTQLCQRMPIGVFCAATLLEITPSRTQATLWNAALPDAVLIRNGCIHTHCPSGLPPLGIVNTLKITEAARHISLQPNDRLYIFSDGITEARNLHNDFFEMERLEAFLTKVTVGDHPLEDLILLLNDFVGSTTHNDDITLVEVQL
ncbi:MAG: SpoIIE family protein phosphatase [Magnetococcus sp. DMHC-6]